MTAISKEEKIAALAQVEPDVGRILWNNFDPKRAVPLSHAIQEARGVSRQAASKLLAKLVKQGLIEEGEGTRPKTYFQPVALAFDMTLPIKGLEEHVVWAKHFRPTFERFMGKEAIGVWDYGFTEMLNNAKEHSQGKKVRIRANVRVGGTSLWITDNGEGIFKRIARLCNLTDERQAILELAKGKLTTDPENHSGEGVFFSARAFDQFVIDSGGLRFDHKDGEEDWLVDREKESPGTMVWMALGNHTTRELKSVFDEFSVPDEYTFSKTVVPVRLARYGQEGLVSRSQAQRLLARVDRFKVVIFDFEEVETIGQAFADEIFRVYAGKHPEVELLPVNASAQVQQMIVRATAMT